MLVIDSMNRDLTPEIKARVTGSGGDNLTGFVHYLYAINSVI
jgi:hypothetical protein